LDTSEEYGKQIGKIKTDEEVGKFKKENEDLSALAAEISSSFAGIKYWYVANCAPHIDNSDVSDLDCSEHEFVNTKSMKCPKTAPGVGTVWDGPCENFDNDDTCSVKCGEGVSVFPADAPKSVQYTCAVKVEDNTPKAKWGAEKPIQCCTGTCTGNNIYTGECSNGKQQCEACASGKKASNDNKSCVDVSCPENADGSPCLCKTGYKANPQLQFSTSKGEWKGRCVVDDCPTNTQGYPNCECARGSAGSLSHDRQKANKGETGWIGSCTPCVAGQSFSTESGIDTCTTCKQCDAASEVEKTACTSTQDRTCQCKAGFYGEAGKCTQCQSGKYTDENGKSACDECMVCNSMTEMMVSACQPSSNTVCRCKPPYGTTNNGGGCYEIVDG